MNKIAIINGSPRKNGATATLLEKMSDYLSKKRDVEIQFINISDYNLKSCIGCTSCYRVGKCCLNDNVEEINHIISECDGIIIGTPTYVSSMPGLLKTFIDRGHFILEQALLNKYTFVLNTFEIAGGGSVLSSLKTLFQYSGGILAGSHICKIPFDVSPFENKDEEKKLIKKAENFYRLTKNKNTKALIDKLINYIALRLIMKPQVMKRPEQYTAVIERWKKIGVVK
jgi:multimeric flavodoxin WrbA